MGTSKKFILSVGVVVLALTSLTLDTLQRKLTAEAQTNKLQNTVAQTSLNRIIIAFPGRSDSADLQKKANAIAEFISKKLSIPVKAVVADDTAAVKALRANRAQVAFLSSRPAIKEEQLANARLYLAEVRPNYSGGHTYKSIFIVLKDSPLSSGSSPETLQQLRGKKIAFTSPTSGSGFIFPVGELVKLGLVPNRSRLNTFFGQVSYGNGYSGALQAVLRGQADVATVSEYTLGSPYITPQEASRLRVLYAISGVPADGVAIDDSVPAPMRDKIINAMLELNRPENNQLLRSLSNSTQLVKVNNDTHLQPMRQALQRAGIKP